MSKCSLYVLIGGVGIQLRFDKGRDMARRGSRGGQSRVAARVLPSIFDVAGSGLPRPPQLSSGQIARARAFGFGHRIEPRRQVGKLAAIIPANPFVIVGRITVRGRVMRRPHAEKWITQP